MRACIYVCCVCGLGWRDNSSRTLAVRMTASVFMTLARRSPSVDLFHCLHICGKRAWIFGKQDLPNPDCGFERDSVPRLRWGRFHYARGAIPSSRPPATRPHVPREGCAHKISVCLCESGRESSSIDSDISPNKCEAPSEFEPFSSAVHRECPELVRGRGMGLNSDPVTHPDSGRCALSNRSEKASGNVVGVESLKARTRTLLRRTYLL